MWKLLALGLVLFPAAASALPPLRASLGYAAQVAPERPYDLVDDDDHLPMLRVSAGYGLAAPQGELDLDLAFQTGGTRASLHRAGTASLWLRGLEMGATYRWQRWGWVEPFARLGLGYDWGTLELEEAEQRDGALALSGLAGASVPLRRSAREGGGWQLALDVGVGYALRSELLFEAVAPEASEDAEAIPVGAVPIGRLPLSGVLYRLGLSLRL